MDRQPWSWRLAPGRCIRCGARTDEMFCEGCLERLDNAMRRGDIAGVEQWAAEYPAEGPRPLPLPFNDLAGDRTDTGAPADTTQTKGGAWWDRLSSRLHVR